MGILGQSKTSAKMATPDIFQQMFGNRPFSWDTFTRMADIDNRTQKHLTKVYGTLAAGILITALGVHVQLNVFHMNNWVTGLGAMFALMYVASSSSSAMYDDKAVTEPKRMAALGAFFLLKGAAIGPLVLMASQFPGVLPTAFFGALAIFTCFSIAALFAKKREYLYLGGLLGSVMTYFFWMSLANIFFRWRFVNDIMLYGGLLVFAGYVIYDTQLIIEQSRTGSKDFPKHALELYVDLVAIFVRLVIILMKNAQEKERKKEERRRRD
eukprot:GDKI01043076.1.p1 GENE.GDKI01043076.1~~GDKI01043076.1.p1  ORF type:complete len:268 (-),score=76.77 GDKI01043076.1:217-1020(-)